MWRKHAFPAMFFIINERLRSPPYGTMFCAAPILSPRPAPFPTLSFPSTCQSEIMIEPGWQAGSQPSAMKARPHSLSVPPPFHAPLPPEVFPPHGLCGLSLSPHSPPPPLCLYSLCFPLWESQLWSASVRRRANIFKHGCHGAMRLGSLNLGVEFLVSLINKSDLVLTGLCICPLSG